VAELALANPAVVAEALICGSVSLTCPTRPTRLTSTLTIVVVMRSSRPPGQSVAIEKLAAAGVTDRGVSVLRFFIVGCQLSVLHCQFGRGSATRGRSAQCNQTHHSANSDTMTNPTFSL